MKVIFVYLSTIVSFVILDAIWLGFFGGKLFNSIIGEFLLDEFRIFPAVLFYILYVAGIMVFVFPLASRHGGRWAAGLYGAFFGLCAYGTYDLTSHAVLRLWTWQLTTIDMAWGTFATAVASLIGAWVGRRMGREL